MKEVIEAYNYAKENKISLRKTSIELRKNPIVLDWIDTHCDPKLNKRQHAKKLYSAVHNGFSFICIHGFEFGISEYIELKFPNNMKNGCCSCYEAYIKSDYMIKKVVNSNKLQKQTKIKKYGESYAKVISKKCIKTNLKKYGVEWSSQNEDIHMKSKQTCRERYGAEFPLQCNDIKDKMKIDSLQIYGVEYPMQSNVVKQHVIENNIKEHGCHPTQLHIDEKVREILQNKNKFSTLLQVNSVHSLAKQFKVSDYLILKTHNNFKLDIIKSNLSLYENEIANWLQSINLIFKRKDRKHIGRKELDFYFPDYQFAIEFQGTFWHGHESLFKETDIHPISGKLIKDIREADNLKAKLCEEKEIDLFCIWEHEWKLNKEEIKKQILVKLGLV